MADWYYAKGGQRHGPVSAAELKRLAQAGELLPDDLVFKEGGKDWIPASTVAGLFGGASAASGAGRVTASTAPRGGDDGGDVEPAPSRPVRKAGSFGDLLMFRRMIAPWVLLLLFWLGVIVQTLGGLTMAVLSFVAPPGGRGTPIWVSILMAILFLISIPLGIFILRLYTEIFIVVFRINENLMDIKEVLERRERG